MPPSVSVRTEGNAVVVVASESVLGGSPAAEIADEVDERSPVERIASAASAVLSGVQDIVMRHFAKQWPLDTAGRAALPYARIDGRRIAIGFEVPGGSIVHDLRTLSLEGSPASIQ
jgi:hypothetical protein